MVAFWNVLKLGDGASDQTAGQWGVRHDGYVELFAGLQNAVLLDIQAERAVFDLDSSNRVDFVRAPYRVRIASTCRVSARRFVTVWYLLAQADVIKEAFFHKASQATYNLFDRSFFRNAGALEQVHLLGTTQMLDATQST